MEKHILHIPTVISHSTFELDDRIINLKEKEINYFYSLLYLFRNNLLNQSDSNVFIKSTENRHYEINPEFENFKVKIELIQFNKLGVVSNYSYKDLRVLFELLSSIKIKINILGKNKDIKIESIKIIDYCSIDKDNILTIKLNDKFLQMIIHTQKYYMEVDLDILFKISGYKSKKLYLVLKDYSNYKNQCIKISKEKLGNIIGNIPTKKILHNIIDSINTITNMMDLSVDYPLVNGKKLKEYKFGFKNLTKKSKQKSNKPVNQEWEKLSEEITNKKIKEGSVKKENKNSYQHTVYKNLEKKNQKTDEELFLEDFINEKIKILKETKRLILINLYIFVFIINHLYHVILIIIIVYIIHLMKFQLKIYKRQLNLLQN